MSESLGESGVFVPHAFPLPPALLALGDERAAQYEIPQAKRDARGRGHWRISEDEVNSEIWTPERAMFQFEALKTSMADQDGKLRAGAFRSGATPGKLVKIWVDLNQAANEIAASRQENPAMWSAYDARQAAIAGKNIGDKVIGPYPTPESKIGGEFTIDRKFAKNWRLLAADGATVLVPPSAIRPVEAKRLVAAPMGPQVGALPPVAAVMAEAAIDAAAAMRERISDVKLGPIDGNVETFTFKFDGEPHIGSLKGRNKGVVIFGDGRESDQAIAVRALLDGDAAAAPEPVKAVVADDSSKLTNEMGGFTQTLDLGKPVWQVTQEEVIEAVDASGRGTDLGKPGNKYDPYKAWLEAHIEAIKEAQQQGKKLPDEVLYDRPNLIRSDLSADEADIACDEMVDVYRATKDFGKAVQAYREYGQEPAKLPVEHKANAPQAAPAPIAALSPVEVARLPLAGRWAHILQATMTDGGDQDEHQRSFRAFTHMVVGSMDEKPLEAWDRWSSFIGSTELATKSGTELLKWMESNLLTTPWSDDALPGAKGSAGPAFGVGSVDYWGKQKETFEHGQREWYKTQDRLERQVRDVEDIGGDPQIIATSRSVIMALSQAINTNGRAIDTGLAAAEQKVLDDQMSAEAVDAAKYKPADLKQLSRKPGGASISGWFTGTYQGNDVLTNGKIVDLVSEPHLAGWESRLDPARKGKSKVSVDRIMPNAAGDKMEVIGVYDGNFGEAKGVVYFEHAEAPNGEALVGLDVAYVQYFSNKFKGAEFHRVEGHPVVVLHGGERVGLIGPLNLGNPSERPSVAEIKEKVAASQATNDQPVAPKTEPEQAANTASPEAVIDPQAKYLGKEWDVLYLEAKLIDHRNHAPKERDRQSKKDAWNVELRALNAGVDAAKQRRTEQLVASSITPLVDPKRVFRDPDGINALRAPIEHGDWFKLQNGEEWQARQGYSGRGWSLVRDGQLHPDARNLEAQVDFARAVIAVTEQAPVAQHQVEEPGSRAPKVDDLKTYTTKEAKSEWDRARDGERAMILRRVDMSDSAIRTQSWDEMSAGDRKILHVALNEDFYAPMWYTNTSGVKVSFGPVMESLKSQALIDFEAGELLWNESKPGVKHRALLNSGIGQDADVAKDLPWGELGPDVRAKLLVVMRAQTPAQETVTAAAVPLASAAVARNAPPKPSAARNLRAAAYEKNPFLTFLATHGLYHDQAKPHSLKSEFSPDKAIMVSGYGPIFKKTGARLDLLTQVAIQDGYLPLDGTEQQLYGLIQRAIAGQKISPVYAEGVAEEKFALDYAQYQQQQEEAYAAGEFDPFTPLAEFGYDLDDAALAGYNELEDPIKLEVNALLALAEDMGIDTDLIKEDAQNETHDQSEQALYESARTALKAAIAAGPGRGIEAASRPSVARVQEGLGYLSDGEGAPDAIQEVPTFEVKLQAGQFTMVHNVEFLQAKAYAQTLPSGQYALITIERAGRYTDSAAEPTRYGAWVSNGDSTATYVDKPFPASRESLAPADVEVLHVAAIGEERDRAEKIAEARKYRTDLIASKQLHVGAEWTGAQAYVSGKRGITTFSKSVITDIQADGFLTVESTLRGSNRLYKFTIDANSRLFESYHIMDSLTAPTREDVLAQQARLEAEQQRQKDGGDKPMQRKVTVDQVDLFNPQASVFDAPAEPDAEYRYAMVNRPFEIGTAPRDGFVRTEERPASSAEHFDVARHGILVYNRELTDAETKQFELAPIPGAQQLAKVVDAVVEDMREYASAYLEMAQSEPDHFGGHILDRAKATATGYPVSVGDSVKFIALVQAKLAALAPAVVAAVAPVADVIPVEQYIKVAADSIAELRKVDVYRVLVESNRAELRPAIAKYIKDNRPDLAGEVDEVLAEAAAQAAAPAVMLPDESFERKFKVLVAVPGSKPMGYPEVTGEKALRNMAVLHARGLQVVARTSSKWGTEDLTYEEMRDIYGVDEPIGPTDTEDAKSDQVVQDSDSALQQGLEEPLEASVETIAPVDVAAADPQLEAARKLLLEYTNGRGDIFFLAGRDHVEQRVKLMAALMGKEKVTQAEAGVNAISAEFYKRAGIDMSQIRARSDSDFLEWVTAPTEQAKAVGPGNPATVKSVRAPAHYQTLAGLLAATERVLQSDDQSFGGQSRGMWLTNAEYVAVMLGDGEAESVRELRKKYAVTRRQDLQSDVGGDAVFGVELPKRSYIVGDNVPGVGLITDEVDTPHGKQFKIGSDWILESILDPDREEPAASSVALPAAPPDEHFYYVDGTLGMKNHGAFTWDKSNWMAFTRAEASRMHAEDIKPYGATRVGVFVGTTSGKSFDTAVASEQPDADLVEPVVATDATIDGDLRGYAYALVKDGQIITSGSFPTKDHMAAEDRANVGHFKAEADAKGADLYIGGYPGGSEWTSPEGLIFGMTWEDLSARQQGRTVSAAIAGKMPTNAVLAYEGQPGPEQSLASEGDVLDWSAAKEVLRKTRPLAPQRLYPHETPVLLFIESGWNGVREQFALEAKRAELAKALGVQIEPYREAGSMSKKYRILSALDAVRSATLGDLAAWTPSQEMAAPEVALEGSAAPVEAAGVEPGELPASVSVTDQQSPLLDSQDFLADPETLDADKIRRGYEHRSLNLGEKVEMERKWYVDAIQRTYDQLNPLARNPEQQAKLKEMLREFRDEYRVRRYRVMEVGSGSYSALVAGRSNFNQKQAEQRSNALDKSDSSFSEWLEAWPEAIKAALLGLRTDEERDHDNAEAEDARVYSLVRAVARDLSEVAAIDVGKSMMDRASFVNGAVRKIANLHKAGETTALTKVFAEIAKWDAEHTKPLFTARSSVWQYKPTEVASDAVAAPVEAVQATGVDSGVPDVAAGDVGLQASVAADAAKRRRPTATIEFPNAIVGPSGSKLIAYTWQWKPFEYVDKTGEDRTGRMSDWDKAEESQDTGREVVHQFQVADTNGDVKVVSAESALALLGYLDKSQAVTAQGAISAVKTLARNRMQLAELEAALAAYTQDKAQVDQMEFPPVVRGENDKWLMGDATVWQSIKLFPSQKDGELLPERLRGLQEGWRSNRLVERGWNLTDYFSIPERINETKLRIKKAQMKVDNAGKQVQPVQPVASDAMLKVNFMMALDGVYVDGTNQEVPENWSGVAIEGSNGRGGYFFVTKADGHIVDTQRLQADNFEAAMELAQEQGLDVSQSLFAPVGSVAKVADATPTSPVENILEAQKALWKRLYEGSASVEEFKAGFETWVSQKDEIVALLSPKKKDDLLALLSGMMRSRYKSDNKSTIVDQVWREGLSDYVLWRSYSYGMGKDAQVTGIRAMVEKTDAAQLAEFAAKVKQSNDEAEARASKVVEAIKDPKTKEDYNILMRATMSGGKTFKEARLALTPEQRAHYDDLVATDTRSGRKTAMDEQRTNVGVAGQKVEGDIIATKHTKKGHDLFVVQLSERVSKEDYDTLASGAKRIGGYYSSYRGAGAVPGFQFTSRAQAEAFVKLAEGDNTAAKEAAQANRDAFQDDRSQTAVERLTEMADRLEDRADSSLGQDRKQNTHRRAAQAARAESAANADKAMAVTMRNIAQSIDGGGAKFLDRVRQKVQVSMLQSYVVSARYDEMRGKGLNYEKYKDEPPTMETADYAEFPTFTAYRSDLATLARQLVAVDGTKLIGQRLLKVADDVSATYLEFAQKNYAQVASFRTKDGESAIFGTRDAAEAAIARSGYKGRAIAYQVKRGEHTVILSPSEAVERGVWKGDGDARLVLSPEFGVDLVEKIGKAARRGSKVSVPWQLETSYDRRKALARMGIETPAEFRASLREFIGLQERPPEPDKIKALERAMIGRRNDGMDFFPTAESNADEMVATANVEPGMSVYEPHGGWGHIAERIRAAGVEPDVGELSSDRRELLEAKGFRLVSSDFLDVKPDSFFIFGDTFKALDGSEGLMQAGAGLAEGEVLLVRADGSATVHDRDDLVAVAKNAGSGYDRILMNPPFSDGRDIQHVMHAYSLLNPRGRIVSLMGESAFTNQNARATEFREWLDSMGASVEKLPEGSFMDPSLPVNTGANARMVVIDRPDYGLELAPVQVVASVSTELPTTTTDSPVVDTQPVEQETPVTSVVEAAAPAVQVEEPADPIAVLEESGFEVSDLALTGFETSTPEIQREVAALLDVDRDQIVQPTQGESYGSTADSIAPSIGDSDPDSGQPPAQADETGANADIGTGVTELAGSVQSVQPAARDGIAEEALEAAQALLDEAKALTYPLPYLAERLAEGMNPADAFHVHLLEMSIEESRDYNRLMLAHAGDFAGLEFKHKRATGVRDRYAFALPDASRPGQWRISYFDAAGFSNHDTYPTQEKAQQALVTDGYAVEAAGVLDLFSQTQEWAIGTATGDLMFQLNTRKITHAEFNEKHKALLDSYAPDKGQGVLQAAPAPVESQVVSGAPAPAPASVANAPAVPAVPHALIGGVSYPLTTYKTNGGKILSGIWVPTRAIALNVTDSTFQKRPFGWFIRERDFPEGALQMTAPVAQAVAQGAPDETVAPVAPTASASVGVEVAVEEPVAAIVSPAAEEPVALPVADVPEAAQVSAVAQAAEAVDAVETPAEVSAQPVADEQEAGPAAHDLQTASNEAAQAAPADVAEVRVAASVAAAEPVVQADKSPDGTGDAGAELTYNKRNRIKTGLKWTDLQDLDPVLRVSETTKEKVYPKPDYQALVNDGMPALIAHLVKQCYDAISVKPEVRGAPTDEDLQLYIKAVNRYMNGVMQWANDEDLTRKWIGAMARQTGITLSAMNGQSILVSNLIERPEKSMVEVVYGVDWRDAGPDQRSEIKIIGTNKPLGALGPRGDEVRRAMKDIDKGWPGKVEAWQKQGYRILLGNSMTASCYESGLRGRDDKVPYVTVSLIVMEKTRHINLLAKSFAVESKDHPVVVAYIESMLNEYKDKHLLVSRRNSLVSAFESHDLAVEGAREETKREKSSNTIDDKGISVEMAQRQGTQWREDDRDVTTEELVEVFGFKGVNFGNWMKGSSNQAERQLHVNHLYDAFMDLSEILEVPPRSMSLDGMLGIAVGAQGNGQYAAHFVPGVNEINITRTAGAGSVAHEWGHALDHFFARLAGKVREAEPYLTEHASGDLLQRRVHKVGDKLVGVGTNRFGTGIRPEVIRAFKDIVTAMNERPMTVEELREKGSVAVRKTRKNVESWIGALEVDYKRRGMSDEFVAAMNPLFERARNGDLGVGRVGQFAPVIEDIRQVFKLRTGSVPAVDHVKGLQQSAEHLQYLLAKGDEPTTNHVRVVATDFANNAQELDGEKGGKSYWSTNCEKFARSLDVFVSDALEANGRMNSYLSHTGRTGKTVPMERDRAVITVAFSELIKLVQNQELMFDGVRDVEHDAAFAQRVQDLAKLEKGAGVGYTFWRLASDALRDAGGVANDVDWARVEDAAIVQSIATNDQAPDSVSKVLREVSPGMVSEAQQADLERRIAQVVSILEPNSEKAAEQSLTSGQ